MAQSVSPDNQETRVVQAHVVHLVSLVFKVDEDLMVKVERTDPEENVVMTEMMVLMVLWVSLVLVDHLVLVVALDVWDLQDLQVLVDELDQMDHKDKRVQLDLMDQMDK